jgi:sugar phosphate isomerase/epimerase
MHSTDKGTLLNRRNFLQTGIVAAASFATANFASTSMAAVEKPNADPYAGLKMGITTYTFHKFTLDQAIAMTKQSGVKYVSIKDVHLPLKSTKEQREEAARKVKDAGLTLMGGGVIYLKNSEADIRNAFEYCRDTGMATMVCSPEPDALDTMEKYAKQFDIKIAVHNHGPGDKKYPSPLDVLKLVKDRDARMGMCIDVGHTVRLNQDPIPVMKQCAKRLYEFHMKDVNAPTGQGKPVVVGQGIIDEVAVLKELRRQKFQGEVALEFEASAEDPMPGVLQSLAYLRGILATMV